MSDVRPPRMRRADGRPGHRIRIVAGLLAVGLLAIDAPLAVFPAAHWIGRHV